MNRTFLAIAAIVAGAANSHACDKCRNPYHNVGVSTFQSQYVVAAPMSIAPVAAYSTPSTYVASSVMTAPTYVTSTPTYFTASATPATVSMVPSSQSVMTMQTVAPQYALPQVAVAASPVYYYSGVQSSVAGSAETQGVFTDLLIGAGTRVAKPILCEACRNLGCDTSSGGASGDPLKELKDTIEGIGNLIKSVKGLEKSIKDGFSDSEPSVEEAPGHPASDEIATLMRLRDDIRNLNKTQVGSRIAEDIPR